MIPQEKAVELVNKFLKLTSKHSGMETAGLGAITVAKACATTAVDEIIKTLVELSNGEFTFIYEVKYYQDVKQEIEKL